MPKRILTALGAVLMVFWLTACSPSLGAVKTEADQQVASMAGLTDSQIAEFQWRIEAAGEAETVERIVGEAEAASQEHLAAQAAQDERAQTALEPWLDVALVVTWPPQGDQHLVGEVLTLHGDGTITATAGLGATWGLPGVWSVVSHPAATRIEICGHDCLKWVVKDAGAGQLKLVAPVEGVPSTREGQTWLLERQGDPSGS